MEEVAIMAYITSNEYAALTGRDTSEATTIRLNISSKLLDSRIGNYGTYQNGWKIDTSGTTWYINNFEPVTVDQKEAIQMWIAEMIKNLYLNGDSSSQNNDLRLGRFSVSKSKNSTGQILPESMGYIDSILISSGIINRRIGREKSYLRESGYYI
jgi:hypothetical protein